ncbi:TIGR00730 family Rossman fold protein [Rhodococcus opacus]|uniref:Cytokinin riboside 5'-monophosphate phosphoribohydrolase n=1 Tax=Rhodococcus opacus TaxID=37919 RepID=A0A076EYE2_RHOOP|nr:TIGR00730 family Rossman fold protein [Rhodococcus opacus]AII10423.1 DNA-binding protein [Rhodococcus opacus]
MRITAFMGSASGRDEMYMRIAASFGRELAVAGVGLVYGGGNVGLMGAVADASLASGGEVIGVIPRQLVAKEIAHTGLTHLETAESMHARKQRMAELGVAFVVLPGGAGTLDEFFEIWTWQQLGLHTKPVFLLDSGGFWRPLLALIDHMVDSGFLLARHRDCIQIVTSVDELVAAIRRWTPPTPKWDTSVDEIRCL